MSGMKILITGANGHLGTRAVEELSIKNEVYAVVRSAPKATRRNVVYQSIDFSSDWSSDVLPNQIDAVIHLAQSRHYREFPQQALEVFHVNLASTAKLLEYASRAGAKRFILASTGGLHRPSSSVIGEHSQIDPPDGPLAYYFSCKRAAELLTTSYKFLMDVSILRPFFIYGPGQQPDKLIARLVESIRKEQPIKIAGSDGLIINPIFVDDVVNLLIAILDAPGSRIVMAAGPDIVSIRTIAEVIGAQLGSSPIFEKIEGDEGRLIADHRAVEALLERRLTGFAKGISQLLQ
jgi:nucleoside-diphosphate-sugar epimerase